MASSLFFNTRADIESFVSLSYQTLDDVRANRRLAGALEVADEERGCSLVLARALVKNEFIAPQIPDDHPISKGRSRTYSNYLLSEVVGEEIAKANLKKIVATLFRGKTLDDVTPNVLLASMLAVPQEKRYSHQK